VRVFHVTFARRLPSIKRLGITPRRRANWRRAGDLRRYGKKGEIFVFENRHDALRWAGVMDWEFHLETGSGELVVVEAEVEDDGWEVDDADPLRRSGSRGRWLKKVGSVPPECIVGVEKVTKDLMRSVVEQETTDVLQRAVQAKSPEARQRAVKL
jgi:hypothetical protein